MAAERAKVDEMITLDALRNSIPKEVFQKDLFKSLYYLFFDYAVWIGSFYAMYTFTNSPYWEPLPFWAKAVASLLYWNIAGFYMWCLFVVGHDCGHGTFSNNRVLNDVLGHFIHGSISVPFWVRVSYMSMESLTCQSQNFTSLTVSIPSNIS
jgi:omega-3 fatty acid desaturase (delta-15 desaturase)